MYKICGICYDIIDNNNNIIDNMHEIKLKCGHYFHYTCINISYNYTNDNKCPYCRQDGGILLNLDVLCPTILKTGVNKGKRCNCKLKLNNLFCGKHSKSK